MIQVLYTYVCAQLDKKYIYNATKKESNRV